MLSLLTLAALVLALPLIQQAAPPSLLELGQAIVLLVAPVAASAGFGLLKKAVAWVAELPAVAKAMAVLVVNYAIAWLVYFTGLELPLDAGAWTVTTMQGVIMWLGSMGVHALTKAVKSGA